MPAASAARAMNPKWRLFAKLCTCSTHIPVKLATSESVKIFWLDFTVTMARLLCSAPKLLHAYLDAECILRDRKSTRSELQSRQYLVCRLLLEKKSRTYELPIATAQTMTCTFALL